VPHVLRYPRGAVHGAAVVRTQQARAPATEVNRLGSPSRQYRGGGDRCDAGSGGDDSCRVGFAEQQRSVITAAGTADNVVGLVYISGSLRTRARPDRPPVSRSPSVPSPVLRSPRLHRPGRGAAVRPVGERANARGAHPHGRTKRASGAQTRCSRPRTMFCLRTTLAAKSAWITGPAESGRAGSSPAGAPDSPTSSETSTAPQ
jgi:hypothetical protein